VAASGGDNDSFGASQGAQEKVVLRSRYHINGSERFSQPTSPRCADIAVGNIGIVNKISLNPDLIVHECRAWGTALKLARE
jgi:hypothetical protein